MIKALKFEKYSNRIKLRSGVSVKRRGEAKADAEDRRAGDLGA
jgi:hypothetical protein